MWSFQSPDQLDESRTDHRAQWSAVLALLRQYGHQLLRIARGQVGAGQTLGPDDAEDLVQSFALDRLPTVSLHLERLTPSEQGGYIRAAFRNYVRDAVRRQRSHERALSMLAAEPEWIEGDGVVTSATSEVLDAASTLPASLAAPVRLFLGADGAPHSIREIASALDISRYQARLAVLDGLLALAVHLGHRGVLSARQVEACRLVLLEGRSWGEAAAALRLTTHQVRSAVHQARAIAAHLVEKPTSNRSEP